MVLKNTSLMRSKLNQIPLDYIFFIPKSSNVRIFMCGNVVSVRLKLQDREITSARARFFKRR